MMKGIQMKRIKLITIIGLLALPFTFFSCSDDDGYSLNNYWLEVATIEPLDGGLHYYRLDDSTTLWPASGYYLGHNLQDGQRVWLNYTLLSGKKDGFDHYIKVNGLDPILTKKIAENKGKDNNAIYGTDPVGIRNIWVGDGYLNVLFTFNYGGQKRHFVNLIQENSDDDPYTLEFRHNAYDDPPLAGVRGIVCFDLSDLPDTEGETVKLKIRVRGFGGDKVYELNYNSDKSGSAERVLTDEDDHFERVN